MVIKSTQRKPQKSTFAVYFLVIKIMGYSLSLYDDFTGTDAAVCMDPYEIESRIQVSDVKNMLDAGTSSRILCPEYGLSDKIEHLYGNILWLIQV